MNTTAKMIPFEEVYTRLWRCKCGHIRWHHDDEDTVDGWGCVGEKTEITLPAGTKQIETHRCCCKDFIPLDNLDYVMWLQEKRYGKSKVS